MMHSYATTPLFIIFAGTVMIALISLTMRAVIRRDKAMINTSMDEPHEVAAYVARWRTTGRELASDPAATLAAALPPNRSAA